MVFFDLVGTLIEPRGTIGSQYAAVAGRFGITANAQALEAAFRAVTAGLPTFAMPDMADPDLEARERRLWQAIVRGVFTRAGLADDVTSGRFTAYFEALFDHFASADAWHLFPDARPALDRLSRSGLGLGLITNFDSRVFRLLDQLGLARSFASVTIPAVAGAAKPDPAILYWALRSNGLGPAGACYVGDSVSEDVAAAVAAGVPAVLIDRAGAHPPVQPGVRRIRSLMELAGLV